MFEVCNFLVMGSGVTLLINKAKILQSCTGTYLYDVHVHDLPGSQRTIFSGTRKSKHQFTIKCNDLKNKRAATK